MTRPSYLLISIVEHRARGFPNRALILHCEIRNPNPDALYIADAWLEVRLPGGRHIAEGRLFHALYNLVDPAIVSAGGAKTSLGEITIPLTSTALEAIEEVRKGGDLSMQIDSRILVSAVADGSLGPESALRVPIESRFAASQLGGAFEFKIPQSEWVKLLRQLEWSEIELMELPTARLRSDQRFARARERLTEAETCLGRGDWEGVLQNCRKAWEAAAIGLTGEEDRNSALPKLQAYFGEGLKSEHLNSLAKKLGDFLHLARHDQVERVFITRADAVLAIRLTASLLEYLART